jgi:hypothetical protein
MIFKFRDGSLSSVHSRTVRSVPLPIDDSLDYEQRIIFACLVDWLQDERQARALTVPTAKQFSNRLGSDVWMISEDELESATITVLCSAKEAISGPTRVEYIGGQRRDTLRAQTVKALPS